MAKTLKQERSDPPPPQEESAEQGERRPSGRTSRRSDPKRYQKDTLQVVEFLLGKERYAVDLFDVKEVVEYTTITKLPNTASYMKGIIDLRGEITTIVDLKDRLHIADAADAPEENSRIIVLDEKITGAKTGIMVDDVLSVSTFDTKDIDSTSATEFDDDSAILGIIKKRVKEKDREKNELIIWIDIKHLLKSIGGKVG